jgi:phage/plasmid-like protein (TIGR03299 family)
MAHNLEMLPDGQTAFFAAREHAWHQLGTVTQTCLTSEEATKTAHLDWEVTKEPIFADFNGSRLEIPGKYATVRNAEFGVNSLGVVGDFYKIVQNLEAAQVLDAIVDESGAMFESAGSLRGGKKVFYTMRLPKDIMVGGKDLVGQYLLLTNTHDGSEPLKMAVTPVRAVCQNTVTAALNSAVSTYFLRHTTNVTGRIQEAREALKISWRYTDEFAEVANGLYERSFSDEQFEAFLADLMPAPFGDDISPRVQETYDERIATVKALWKAPTQANIANTAWAAFNTAVEYVDWFAPVKGKDADARRAERVINGDGNTVKNRALELLGAK